MKLKKMLAWLLLAALLLSPGALAAEGDRNFLRGDEPFQSLSGFPTGGCAAGGALYLYTDRHIYVWRAGDGAPEAIEYALPSGEEGETRKIARLFANGEGLCALCEVDDPADGVTRLEIAEVRIDGDAVSFGEAVTFPADGLTVSYGDESALAPVYGAVAAGGKLALDVWTEARGRSVFLQPLDGGAGEFLDVENVAGICAYDGDRLLVQSFDYDRKERTLMICDPAGDALTPAAAPAQAEAPLYGLAQSAESGRLFYLADGYVMAAEGLDFESAQPVAELSARYPDEASACLLDGDLYACIGGYDGVCIRSTAAGALPETRIVVQGGGIFRPMMDAYYDFNASHSDAAVVLREDYSDDSAVLNDIVSRDDSVDVRVTMASSELYDALRARGYLAPLDDETLAAAADGMYPAIREALTLDGQLVAVPVYVACWTLGLDFEGFERIGIPRDEMPSDWVGFLELLPTLPERIGEDGSVRIFSEYATQTQVRTELIGSILESWQMHLRMNDMSLSYDSPELAALLEAAMALDLEALGVNKGGEDDEYMMIATSSNYLTAGERDYTLIETNADCTLSGMGCHEPALLSAAPGEAAPLPLDLAVVFVNPFSKHPDLAQEYLADVYANLAESDLYSLSGAYNDPVISPAYERELHDAEQALSDAQENLASAAPEDAPRWEDAVDQCERQIESLEANRYLISPENLAWYRAHGERLMVRGYDPVDVTDASGEFADLIRQFLSGRMDASAFLRETDRRVQMQAREAG